MVSQGLTFKAGFVVDELVEEAGMLVERFALEEEIVYDGLALEDGMVDNRLRWKQWKWARDSRLKQG